MKFTTRQKRQLRAAAVIGLAMVILAEPALAGTTGSGSNPFAQVIVLISGYLKGGLGQLLSLISLAVGLVAGVTRGSLIGAVTGIGIAICAYWGPDVLASMFGAVALHAPGYVTVACF